MTGLSAPVRSPRLAGFNLSSCRSCKLEMSLATGLDCGKLRDRQIQLLTQMRPTSDTPSSPLRILCAEDDGNLSGLVSLFLKVDGHRVDVVANGAQALARATSQRAAYDIVITDNQMPELDGLRLVTKLREAGYPGKIIVLTGHMDSESRAAFEALGVDRILTKPFRSEVLLQAVNVVARGPAEGA